MSVARASGYARESAGGAGSWPWAWLVVAGVVAVLAYGPLLGMFFVQQWEKPHYQYFPFVIVAFGWLFWQRWSQGAPRTSVRTGGEWVDWSLLAASLLLLATGLAIHSPWSAMASLILLAAYGCRTASRMRDIVNLWGVWFLLVLLLPAPFSGDEWLIRKLQRLSSLISSFALDAVGVNHLMEGNNLKLPNKELFVDEACSGIISILSVVACAVIYAVVKNRSPLHMLLLAVVGMGWATVINVGRISSIAYVYDLWGLDWSSGWQHETLSLVLFIVTFLALLSSDLILAVLLEPIMATWHEVHAADLHLGAWIAKAWDWLVTLGQPSAGTNAPAEGIASRASQPPPSRRLWLPVALMAPLALVSAGLFALALRATAERYPTVQRAVAVTSESLPEMIGDLERQGFEATLRPANDMNGKYSRTFKYSAPDGTEYVVSFDFPFIGGWHELTECYLASGWEKVRREIRTAPEGAGGWKYVVADFEKPNGGHSTVFFTEFDQFGDPLTPVDGWDRPLDPFLIKRNLYLETRKTLQVQVFVSGAAPASEAQRATALMLLQDVRARFHQLAERSEVASNAQSPPRS